MSARLVIAFGALVVLGTAPLGGCVGSSTSACADGRVCPGGTVCSTELGRCANPAAVKACGGHTDGDTCSYPGVAAGACASGVCVLATCGDGSVTSPEVCDDGNQRSGDGCAADCLSDERCGNGVVDLKLGEGCDDGEGPDSPTDACRPDCSLRTCGDGELDSGEVCDDGNDVAGDGCDARCASNETCGNGVFDPQTQETCDDGDLDSGDGCTSACKIEACGNNIIDVGEVCDEGDTVGGDGCSANCRSDETCGNGVVDPPGESCDDDNTDPGDGCDPQCHTEVCGNGVRDAIGTPNEEVCDDDNTTSGDGCSADCRSDETCGNGYVDIAKGEECDPVVADPTQCRACKVPRCGDGVVDGNRGEECDDPAGNSDAPNAACRTNCLLRRCGDGITDNAILEPEVCDDGNFVSGDGCSPDCRSDERCGNSVIDYAIGERCDDGGLVSHDGCASACQIETLTWTPHALDTPYRFYAVPGNWLAYDAARGRTVLFIGYDTWERDAGSWVRGFPVAKPGANQGVAVVYDAARQYTLLFGGASGSVYLAETWAWEGRDWRRLSASASPPGRSNHALAFDAARNKVVLFGGKNASGALADTWEWSGTTWTQIAPTTSPSAREGHVLAYDPVHDRTVLFGGTGLADTWIYDGTTWTQQTPAQSPSARANAAFAFDPGRGTLVLFGGRSGATNLDDTWEWNGANWLPITPVTKPSPVPVSPSMAYDLLRSRLQLVAAQGTWEWTGTTWTAATLGGPDNQERGLAYDALRGRVVYASESETWEWTGLAWTPVTTAQHPNMCSSSSSITPIAYDAARAQVVNYGIATFGSVNKGATWVYDGATWTAIDAGLSPALFCLINYGLAYDPIRKRVVLFGGKLSFDDYKNFTYEWDGTSWQDRSPGFSPSGRELPAMAWDPVRAKIVMFGGLAGTSSNPVQLGDTWEWDGTTWSPLSPSSAPTARSGHGMVYDTSRTQMIMYGGNRGNGAFLNDVWAWDGVRWKSLLPAVQTSGSSDTTPLAFAATSHQVVTAHTVLGAGNRGAWTLRDESTSPSETCTLGFDADRDGLLGCADSDCAAYCDPLCATYNICGGTRPRCGDGTCSSLENGRVCPADCTISARCGDFICDSTETVAGCPGDCL